MRLIKQFDPISQRTFMIRLADKLPLGYGRKIKEEARERLAYEIKNYNKEYPTPITNEDNLK